jgi:NAD(P)H-hydrate epimerase
VQPIVTPEEMNAIDAAAPEPVEVLVERAGRAVARAAIEMLGGGYGRTVNAIVGPGNNGADGRVGSRVLRRRGVRVREFEVATITPGTTLPDADLVIDAAFGTGFRGDWTSPGAGDAIVLAVDVPSGLNALTGTAGPGVLRADRTVTFQALKPGLLLAAGPDLAGEVTIAEIGLDVTRTMSHLVEPSDVAAWWPSRSRDAHKWRSALRVIAGSPAMLGAARLSAGAAARAGSGLVSLSSPGTAPHARDEIVQPTIPSEAWARAVLDDLDRFSALAVGPGLGRSPAAMESVVELVAAARCPVVIDGDGISAFAVRSVEARASLRSRTEPTILTPHDREFEILTGERPGSDRIRSVREAAADLDCSVLLKGPATIVAAPDGRVLVVDHGDERLATAGSGDVLTGMIGAALAVGAPALEAAAAAAWLHAEAARLVPAVGLLAGDLVESMPRALAGLV